jgi:hypothetical protein
MPAEDAVLNVLPEGQPVLVASFLETGESVAAAAAGLTTGRVHSAAAHPGSPPARCRVRFAPLLENQTKENRLIEAIEDAARKASAYTVALRAFVFSVVPKA